MRQRAVIGPHWFGYGGSQGLAFETPFSVPQSAHTRPVAPEPKMVDRNEPGYLIATELIEMWKENSVLPEGSKVKAQKFNAAMNAAGLLTRVDGT